MCTSEPHHRTMTAITSSRSARRMLVLSIVARLPLAMLSIALLVHAQHLTGSFAAAGAGQRRLRGRARRRRSAARPARRPPRADRRAARPRASTSVALLVADRGAAGRRAARRCWSRSPRASGWRPRRSARACAPAAGLLTDPPIAAYAVEASAVELTWVFGPPLALGAGALWSTGAALAARASRCWARRWRSPPSRPRANGAATRGVAPARRLARARRRCARSCSSLVAVGVLFGAVEVAVTAAASEHGSTAAAGPLLALWGAGSLIGGALSPGWRRRAERRRARADARRPGRRPPRADRRRRQPGRASAPCCCSPAPRSPPPTRRSTSNT